MPFFRGDDTAAYHRKFKRAGLDATGLYWLSMSYAALYLTDGRVDGDYLEEREPSKAKRDKLVAKLVETRLFEDNGNGLVIHDYLDYNPSREEVLRRRKEAAKRKREERERRGDVTRDDF